MQKTKFSIIRYHSGFDNAIASLIIRLDEWFEPDAAESIIHEITSDTGLLAVDADNRVIGFLVTEFDEDDFDAGRILWAGVHPAWHRRGVGRALINNMLNEAQHANLQRIYVETMSDEIDYPPFEQTRRFYQALGFEVHRELGDLAGNGLTTTDWIFHITSLTVD